MIFISKDGKVTIADAYTLKDYLLKKPYDKSNIVFSNGDIDGDRKITSIDYAWILKLVYGKIKAFPVK